MSINVEFLIIRTVEITAGGYLVSITKIVSDCQQIGTWVLLIISNYILGLLWGNQFFFLFDCHRKDKIGRTSAMSNEIWFVTVIEKLYSTSTLLKLPNDSLLPSTILKTKIH